MGSRGKNAKMKAARKGQLMPDFKIARVFSNDMVLQRGKNINVFGTGIDGTRITVTLCGKRAACTVKAGKWLAVLPPMSEVDSTEMSVTDGKDSVVFYNVAVGEVWLAGGQSNMEYELCNCTHGMEHIENDGHVNVRFYYTPKKTLKDEDFYECENNTAWRTFEDKESARLLRPRLQ